MVKKFSWQLENWLKDNQPKTLASLGDVFGEKSFAIAFLLLLGVPALPIPTGGITHVFEIIAMLLALEMIIGQRVIWLPRRWRKHGLGKGMRQKILPFLMRSIQWFERFARPRLSGVLDQAFARTCIGILILGFTIVAFFAPPFSGLDTLPALGVVVMSLGVILEDIVVVIIGSLIGVLGVGVVIGLGTAIVHALGQLF